MSAMGKSNSITTMKTPNSRRSRKHDISHIFEPMMHNNRSSHNKPWICSIVTSFIIFLGSVAFVNASNFYPIFGKTIRDVANDPRYKLLISPANQTFSIWGVIYSLLLCVHLYSLTTICRRGKISYLYLSPGMISKRMLLLLSISYIGSCVWQVLFLIHDDLHSMIPSAVVLVAVASINYLVLSNAQFRNYHATIHNVPPLSIISKRDNILFQALVVNSVALYFGWTFVAANLSIGIAIQEHVLKDGPNDSQSIYEQKATVSIIVLTIFTVWLTLYAILDYSTINMTAYTVLQYVAILVGLFGIYYGSSNETSFAYDNIAITDSTLFQDVKTFNKKQIVLVLITVVMVYLIVKINICLYSCIKYTKKNS